MGNVHIDIPARDATALLASRRSDHGTTRTPHNTVQPQMPSWLSTSHSNDDDPRGSGGIQPNLYS